MAYDSQHFKTLCFWCVVQAQVLLIGYSSNALPSSPDETFFQIASFRPKNIHPSSIPTFSLFLWDVIKKLTNTSNIVFNRPFIVPRCVSLIADILLPDCVTRGDGIWLFHTQLSADCAWTSRASGTERGLRIYVSGGPQVEANLATSCLDAPI